MNVHHGFETGKRSYGVAMGFICLALTASACVAARATPTTAGSPTPTPPIVCDDGPLAFTPMPADCVMPSQLATEGPSMLAPATPYPTFPSSLATLPPVVPWHGRTLYTPPPGSGSQLIGLGPDDTIYVLLVRPLSTPQPSPATGIVVPDVAVSVIALRPDGSLRSGWPSGGVAIAGFPISYQVNDEGTVIVASGDNPYGPQRDAQRQLTITAIGSDGKVLPGWPYLTPPSQQYADPNLLVVGPGGMVCFINVKPGASANGYDVPKLIYCLGRDGKLLPGWPYAADRLWNLAIGPDGTVYVAQTTSTDLKAGWTSFPYQVLAIGLDGRPKPGWTPWNRAGNQDLTAIMPTKDGRVYMLVGGDSYSAQLVVVDSTGRALNEHVELGSMMNRPSYKDAVLTADGSLFVSINGGIDVNAVNAYLPDGSQMPGWPQLIGGWGDLAVGRDGSVWVSWIIYHASGGPDDTSVVALFDKSGRLQPGYPMAADYMPHYGLSYGLVVGSDGTAYSTAGSSAGTWIVAMVR